MIAARTALAAIAVVTLARVFMMYHSSNSRTDSRTAVSSIRSAVRTMSHRSARAVLGTSGAYCLVEVATRKIEW